MIPELTKQLRRDEGVKLHAYRDSLGLWTIGVGHLIDPSKGCKPPENMTWPDGEGRITTNCMITDKTCDELLASDIQSHSNEMFKFLPWVKKLDEPRQGVLLNMAFNLGVAGLMGFKNTLALIKGGKYHDAAGTMLDSKWARQVGARAARLSIQMQSGAWQ